MKLKTLLKTMDSQQDIIIVDRGISKHKTPFILEIEEEFLERKVLNLLLINGKLTLYLK